jgi:hypothetical protein
MVVLYPFRHFEIQEYAGANAVEMEKADLEIENGCCKPARDQIRCHAGYLTILDLARNTCKPICTSINQR